MLVMKFGGTSVSSRDSILTICELVKTEYKNQPIIVVSALSKVTDMLVSLCQGEGFANTQVILANIREKHELLTTSLLSKTAKSKVMHYVDLQLNEIVNILNIGFKINKLLFPLELQDQIVFFGEKISSYLISAAILEHTKIMAQQVLATQCIVTKKKFGNADYIPHLTQKNTKKIVLPLIKNGIVPVITGFVGATLNHEITTLGRGGSDYSASILGAALNATEIQIWTDVDGILSADPRYIKTAKPIQRLVYEEASELANLGAKVLHPRTIRPAVRAKIPVKVLNTFNLKSAGSIIVAQISENVSVVKAITSRKFVPLITIKSDNMLFGKGFLQKVFTIFAKNDISVSLISVSEISVSITLDNMDNLEHVLEKLAKLGNVTYEDTYGSLSLVGRNIMETPHLMRDIAMILEQNKIKIHMMSYSASNINVSLILPTKDIQIVLALFHQHFIK